MYVNSSCISLEDVLGTVIGNTPRTDGNLEGTDSASDSNTTTTEQSPTLIPDECQGISHGYTTTHLLYVHVYAYNMCILSSLVGTRVA